MSELRDEVLHERRHDDRRRSLIFRKSELLLADDRDLVLQRPRVMGPDLRTQAVLERRDDASPARVVLGVSAGDDEEVERQADRETADLDVAFLEDVEQTDLDSFGEIGQLVDRKDSAVGARDEP